MSKVLASLVTGNRNWKWKEEVEDCKEQWERWQQLRSHVKGRTRWSLSGSSHAMGISLTTMRHKCYHWIFSNAKWIQRSSASQLISGDTRSCPFMPQPRAFSRLGSLWGSKHRHTSLPICQTQWLKPASFFLSKVTLLLFMPGHGK